MRALIFIIFGLLRAIPIRFDERSECYSTCEIYFPEEWLPYCMEVSVIPNSKLYDYLTALLCG